MNSPTKDPTLRSWLVIEREYHMIEREYIVGALSLDEADDVNLDELTPVKEFDMVFDYMEKEVIQELDAKE